MEEYRRNMAAAIRWATVFTIGVAAFYLVWNAVVGAVPIVESVGYKRLDDLGIKGKTFYLPVPYNRWWDILATPLIFITYWPLGFAIIKLGPILGIKKKGGLIGTESDVALVIGLVFGLLFGLVGLFWGPIAGLLLTLFLTLLFSISLYFEGGWGVSLPLGLGVWLGGCLFSGLTVGLGIGLVLGLVGSLPFFLAANLIIGLKAGLIPSLQPESWLEWLLAIDIEE